jgi:hypothetical protein
VAIPPTHDSGPRRAISAIAAGFPPEVANRLATLAMIFLGLGFVGILILLSDVVLGGAGPLIAGILAAAGIGGLWFVLLLARRSEEPSESQTRELERG